VMSCYLVTMTSFCSQSGGGGSEKAKRIAVIFNDLLQINTCKLMKM